MNTAIMSNKIKFFDKNVMMSTVITLLSGKAGTGKSTVATIIQNRLLPKWDVLLTNFAYGVKRSAFDCFNWDGVKDEKGRGLLQGIGNVGRKYNEDIWCEYVENKIIADYINKNIFAPDIIIIDDWRFPNEADFFDNRPEYQLVKIRVNCPEREILKGTKHGNDISEISLDYYDSFDYTIINSGNILDLESTVCGILSDLELI